MTSRTFPKLARVRYALWGLTVVAASVFAGLYMRGTPAPQEGRQATQIGEAAIRSEFTLTDHTGDRVTEADFLGRWQLVFFGFTYCPDVCPTTLAYMASVLDTLEATADRIAPLFITVDPARDTPTVMADYVSAFHPKLTGLTGSEEDVAAAAHAFRVYYERLEEGSAQDGYLMAHSGHIYLMTPEGRFETTFLEGDQPPEEVARKIQDVIERYGK
ncbi:MAG: SCO family protein [Alphaproteobacteria bacterium]|uniref:SCO family protein n=1 Tax=Pacificispira sp. TaxID=2888761 RepID=UPI00296A3132|nr:SCO family protein [Alphaproteobacteria bacterium]